MLILADSMLKDLSEKGNFSISKVDNTNNGENASVKKIYSSKEGVAFLSEDKDIPTELTLYLPERYLVVINFQNWKRQLRYRQNVSITRASLNMIFLNPICLLYEISNMEKFTGYIRELSKDKKLGETLISEDKIKYSDDYFAYSILLEEGRIVSAEKRIKNTGELISKINVCYGNDSVPTFPKNMSCEFFSKNKCVSKAEYTLSNYKNADTNTCDIFDLSNLDKSLFTDMRFSPIKTYEYLGGIPSCDEAKSLPSFNTPKAANPQKQSFSKESIEDSTYISKVRDFFNS